MRLARLDEERVLGSLCLRNRGILVRFLGLEESSRGPVLGNRRRLLKRSVWVWRSGREGSIWRGRVGRFWGRSGARREAEAGASEKLIELRPAGRAWASRDLWRRVDGTREEVGKKVVRKWFDEVFSAFRAR